MNKSIEILAPAGSYEGMRAAMNAGCDAVYIGGNSFGARAYANNLDENTLLGAIDEAHIRGKKLYLTVNTLLKEREHARELYRFLEKLYRQGLDAVIVQDMGVLHFIHEYFPEIAIHASTQTTLTMAQGVNLLKPYGVTRMVTARELSLKEIRTIRENTDLEIETFVHGALCYCYSGQCLMSSMIGGRSGNRGRCAQPCRMSYQFYSGKKKLSSDQEKYLLSPKDINTLAYIPELVQAGIDSFKIEGRMKRPEYAAMVSRLYRSYVDLYLEHGKEYFDNHIHSDSFHKDMQKLQDIYNRGGFSEGYAKAYHGKDMMSLYRPNHSGVCVGEVASVIGTQVRITLLEEINAQDILDIRHSEEDSYEFTVKDAHNKGEVLSTNIGRRPETAEKGRQQREKQKDKYYNPKIQVGDKVYRTKNNQLLKELEEEYLSGNKRLGMKGELTAKLGERLKLTLSCGDISVNACGEQVQEAKKQPMTREKLLAPIEKTGDTFYYFESLIVCMDEGTFVPVSWLNELRREAISLLMEAVVQTFRRSPGKEEPHPVPVRAGKAEEKKGLGLSVSVQKQEQFEAALLYDEVSAIYGDYEWLEKDLLLELARKAQEAGKEFYLALPHICRLSQYERLKKNILAIIDHRDITGFIVKNFEEIELLQSLKYNEKQKKLIANYNMYTYNAEAKTFFAELGITNYTAPVELNYQELKELGILDCDMIVYGYQPVMVSAQCLFDNTSGCRKRSQGNTGKLVDRLGKSFFVQAHCDSCYNIIYNSQALSLLKYSREITDLGPASIRLDFTLESREEAEQVISAFVTGFCGKDGRQAELADYTTGHFKRGVE